MTRGKMRKWSPAPRQQKTFLGVTGANGAADLGLSLMAAMSVASVWSSISPSYFTYKAFASKSEEERAVARKTLYISLAASTLTSLGIFLVFKKLMPAIVGQAAAVGLFALGMHAVHSEPLSVSTMEQKRAEQIAQQESEEQLQEAA